MALAKLSSLRAMRVLFAVLALFFAVSNIRSLANQAFAPSVTPAPKAAWGHVSAVERAAQRVWARRAPGRSLAAARKLVAVVNRSFFDADRPLTACDFAFDEGGDDEGQPENGAGGELFDAMCPDPAPLGGLVPRAVAPWVRAEAPGAPRDPFCPPIQRPPIALSLRHQKVAKACGP